jgi:hypothetical protein
LIRGVSQGDSSEVVDFIADLEDGVVGSRGLHGLERHQERSVFVEDEGVGEEGLDVG